MFLAGCAPQPVTDKSGLEVRQMTGVPQGESGVEQGVSACYAGVVDGVLMMAGGCNFPETPAAEGGTKRFYRGIYLADISVDTLLTWSKVGELPVEVAYGFSATTSKGMACVGGTNRQGALAKAWRILPDKEKRTVTIDTLPSMPCTLDNMSGAVIDRKLYVVGGNVNGVPSNVLYRLHLDDTNSGWVRLADFPGNPRTQPVCVAQRKEGETCLFLWGGFAAASSKRSTTLSVDGYCYTPSSDSWMPVAVPVGMDSIPVSLGGGNGIAFADSLILCTGGVNKDIFLAALQREELMKAAMAHDDRHMIDSLKQVSKGYMQMPPEDYRFNDRLLVYNVCRNTWKEVFRTKLTARAGASLVGDGFTFFNINGELKPGIRTPMIVKIAMR